MSSSSKPTLQSLNERINALETSNSAQQTLIEALTERIVALEAAAPNTSTAPAKKGRKPKKERAEKDPDAPKRPLGAYMRFCQAKRTEAGPDAKLKATDLGPMWAALSQAEKDAYKPSATATDTE